MGFLTSAVRLAHRQKLLSNTAAILQVLAQRCIAGVNSRYWIGYCCTRL
jgi:hypothetical protein